MLIASNSVRTELQERAYTPGFAGTIMAGVFPMHHGRTSIQTRVKSNWLIPVSTISMTLSVAMLVIGWFVSMTLLVTGSRLVEVVFALP